MKPLTPYLPVGLILAASVVCVYFFYFKPRKEKRDAIAAAKQAADDAALLSDRLQKYHDKITTVAATGSTSALTAML